MQQLPGWPETMLVNELDDGDQFLQLVFQWRTGQHDGIRTIYTFERFRRNRIPVLYPLRLVDDHQFRLPDRNQIQIGFDFFIVGDLAKVIQGIILLTLCSSAGQNLGLTPGETRNLALPLVLERGRADHQHLGYAEMSRQNLGCRDGLDGLAQPHFIADQHTTRANSKQCALGLIGIEWRFEHLLQ